MKNLSTLILSLFFISHITGQGCWKKTESGAYHTIGVKADGTLWAWGSNNQGQLGNGTTSGANSPIQITNSNDWVDVEAGWITSYAIKDDGSLWAWGANASSELGDGTITDKNIPTKINGISNVKKVSALGEHVLAIKHDGTLWAWGKNDKGQLGDGTNTNSSVPKKISNFNDFKSVATGLGYSYAIRSNGTLYRWGNDYVFTQSLTPIQVGTATDWQEVSSGTNHILALKLDKSLYSWGANLYGQLGNGVTSNQFTNLTKIGNNIWKQVSAGWYSSFAIDSFGNLWSWGYNAAGMLGIGNETDVSIPQNLNIKCLSINVGGYFSMMMDSSNDLFSCGNNTGFGSLGLGNYISKNLFTKIVCPNSIFSFNSTSNFSFITLSKTILQVNNVLTITGRDFKPNYSHELRIFSYDSSKTILTIPYTTDAMGVFSKSITIDNTMTGRYLVSTVDSMTNEPVSSKMYEVNNTTNEDTSGRYIKIISPSSLAYYDIGDNNKCQIIWQDKVYNPVVGNTAMSNKSYYIDYNIDSTTWQRAATVTYPSEGVYSTIEDFQYTYTFTKVGSYQFRVTEVNNPDNWDMSLMKPSDKSLQPRAKVQVTQGGIDKNMTLSLEWDYSGPQPASKPFAISADGTSRLFLKIHRISTNTARIKTIQVTANDPQSLATTPELLGRVLFTEPKTKYDLSGDNAVNSTNTTTLPEFTISSDYYFWYKAPDNFSRGSNDYYNGERFINLDVKITYQNNNVENYTKLVSIYRPPLVLVHGWNSDASTWDDFKFTYNGRNAYFKNQFYLFRAGVKLLNMKSDAAFATNAAFLSLQPAFREVSTLSNVIREQREKGIACNRMDYIGHSMGGCMLRAFIELFPDAYNPPPSSGLKYKNYGKGFVNKFITLNTPHNGSTAADLLVEMLPKLPPATIQLFIDLQQIEKAKNITKDVFIVSKNLVKVGNKYLPQALIPTDAVKDMQSYNPSGVNGGIRFSATNNIKTFFVSGQFSENRLGAINNFNKIILNLKSANYVVARAYELLTQDATCKNQVNTVDLINCKMEKYKDTNFMWKSDFVVPMSSQLAGGDYNNRKPYEALFKNDGAVHWGIHHNVKVGDLCLSKLNEEIESPGFTNSIPANTNSGGRKLKSYTLKPADSTIEKFNDMTKFDLLYSIPNNMDVDSILNISINVKDTAKLISNNIVFQGELYNNKLDKGNQKYLIKVNPNLIDTQNLFVTLTYDSMGYNVNYNYIKSIKVNVRDTIKSLKAEPELKYLNAKEEYNPMIYANFGNHISNISLDNSDIAITIADTNVVTFNKNSFVAKDSGTTYAYINYKGKLDTIYMVIAPSYTPIEIKCQEPTVDFDFTINNKTVTLTNKSEFATKYKWSFGNGNTSTSQNTMATYTTNGDYDICLTTHNDCDSAWICKTIKISDASVGLSNHYLSYVSIYPNPASTMLNIDLIKNEQTTVRIENLIGQVLITKTLTNLKNQINISTLSKGIYIIELTNSKSEKYTQKLTVE